MADISLTDLNGKAVDFTEIDKLTFVNPESYGGVGGVVGDQTSEGGRTLIVNVNGFSSALVDND